MLSDVDNDQALTLMFGFDEPEGVEVPDVGALQLAGGGDLDIVEGLGFFKRKKRRGRAGKPRVRPVVRAGAMRRRAGAAAPVQPRVIVQRVNVPAPRMPAPQAPPQSPANTAEVATIEEPAEVFDEQPAELIDDGGGEEEAPIEDEGMEGQLGIFKWAKRTINRNKNTLRAGAGLIPGAGGVIANAILGQPKTPGIVAAKPAAKPKVVRKPAAKPAAKASPLSNQTLLIGGAVLLAVALIGRK